MSFDNRIKPAHVPNVGMPLSINFFNPENKSLFSCIFIMDVDSPPGRIKELTLERSEVSLINT